MQLTAQMLHDAFLQAQREVYGVSEVQQISWARMNDKERLAYEWMSDVLNEKQPTTDARLIAEAPAMLDLIKRGLALDASVAHNCPCKLCVDGRAIIARIEGK